MSPGLKSSESMEIQPKSEEKKRSLIEDSSTNEKEKEDIENEELRPKS